MIRRNPSLQHEASPQDIPTPPFPLFHNLQHIPTTTSNLGDRTPVDPKALDVPRAAVGAFLIRHGNRSSRELNEAQPFPAMVILGSLRGKVHA